MTEIYLYFLFAHYGLYGNAPVVLMVEREAARRMARLPHHDSARSPAHSHSQRPCSVATAALLLLLCVTELLWERR